MSENLIINLKYHFIVQFRFGFLLSSIMLHTLIALWMLVNKNCQHVYDFRYCFMTLSDITSVDIYYWVDVYFWFDAFGPFTWWSYFSCLLYSQIKVDPGKPGSLTWQRKLNSDGNAPVEFKINLRETFHLVCSQIYMNLVYFCIHSNLARENLYV